jgi:pectinesterase
VKTRQLPAFFSIHSSSSFAQTVQSYNSSIVIVTMPSPKGFFHLIQLAVFLGQGPSSGEAASFLTRADNSRTAAPADCIVVRPGGASASEFNSLQAAINSIGSSTKPTCIFLNPGTYNERVEIKVKAPLTLYGSTVE